jgi:hypothetical protein
MKSNHFFAAAALALIASSVPLAAAHADSVLFDSSTVIQGQQSYMQSFDITTPGTLTVTLTNIPWLDTVSNLTGFVTTSSGVLGTTLGAGSESFDVGSGTIYAHWFGDATGTFNAGVVGVKIMFQPTAVGLPASALLLLSGLGVLFGWQRRENQLAATA